MSANTITIVGNVGRDPGEVREAGNSKVTSFSMATSRKIKGEDVSVWYNISVWGDLADRVAEYVHKGDQVTVFGEITENRLYDNKGTTAASLEVRGNNVQFARRSDGESGSAGTASAASASAGKSASKTVTDNEIPF